MNKKKTNTLVKRIVQNARKSQEKFQHYSQEKVDRIVTAIAWSICNPKNNLILNAERKNQKSIKENINISRSEFLPSISLSGDQSSSQSTNKTNSSGSKLPDSNLDTETTTVSIDQKIFQGFKGYNSLKKSELEVKQSDFKLKQTEQQTILHAASAFFDLIFKTKNEEFNLSNVNLFEAAYFQCLSMDE